MHIVTHPDFFGGRPVQGQKTHKCVTMVSAEEKNFQNICLQML